MSDSFKKKFYLISVVLLLALLFPVNPGASGETKTPDGKVATVNGTVITQKAMGFEIHQVRGRYLQQGKALNDAEIDRMKVKILDSLIKRELLYQEGKRINILVDETVIAAELNRMRQQFPGESQYKNALSAMQVTEAEVEARIRHGMTVQQFIEKEIIEKTSVPEKEIRSFYDSHPEYFKTEAQVRASHILIKVDSQADEARKTEAMQKVQILQKKIQNGEDFAALAKQNSECPSSAEGGDLGFFTRGKMVKPFEDAAFAMEPGEVSDVIETQFGFHLIRVVEKKAGTIQSYDLTKERITQYLKQDIVRKKVAQTIEKLREKAIIQIF